LKDGHCTFKSTAVSFGFGDVALGLQKTARITPGARRVKRVARGEQIPRRS
jgi:hypothetical protein